MKRNLRIVGALLLLNCGCSSMNNTQAGALGGAGVGGVAGAVVGSVFHAPLAGAALGAAGGAAIGAASGSNADRAEARDNAAVQQAVAAQGAVQATPPTPSLEDVVSMAQQHLGDGVIINAVRQSPGPYHLAPNQLIWLRQMGVSDAVITAMQAYVPPGAQPVYVVQPPPPPPVVRVYGGGYYGGGYYRRW